MIERESHLSRLTQLLKRFRVVAILGPRQVGKTTLARTLVSGWKGPTSRFDLEDSRDLVQLDDPMLALGSLKGLVVLDEVQRRPELFPTLRVLADKPAGARFLLLGSAAPELLQQSSESLAGRIVYYELPGLSLEEAGAARLNRLWFRGGFPRAFTAKTDLESQEWRRSFIRTYLERDIPELGIRIPSATLSRFWSMLAHYHGQIWHSAEFARSFGVANTTVQRYLDVLTSTFMVRRQSPWHENLGKRQVKAPKVFFRDSGLLHTLLGIPNLAELPRHPKVGASWEGFGIETVVAHLGARPEEVFFWATHGGAELDLLVVRGERRRGFEFKRTSSPQVTPSMRTALVDLKLDSIEVIHAGDRAFAMGPKIRAVPLSMVGDEVSRLQ